MGFYNYFFKPIGLYCLLVCVTSGSEVFANGENTLVSLTESMAATVLVNEPELGGPENLCVIFGSAMAEFSGGGNPTTDVYNWVITNPSGGEHFARNGGATFQNISVQFSELGNYSINLSVRRGNDIIYTGSKILSVIQGPQLVIKPDYLKCGSAPISINAINPNTPNINSYVFEWTNAAGIIVGNQNVLTVIEEGQYFVTLFLANSIGGADCQINANTYVGQPRDFSLRVSNEQLCLGNSVNVSIDTPIQGEWSIEKTGESFFKSVGPAYALSLDSENDLDGPGTYKVVFRTADDLFPNCISEREIYFTVNEKAEFDISDTIAATACNVPDGSFQFSATSPLDFLRIPELAFTANDIAQGEIRVFDNLYPGLYTIETSLNGCDRAEVLIVPNNSPASDMLFEVIVTEETCTATGKINGVIQVVFLNGAYTGSYRVIEASAARSFSGSFSNENSFDIEVPGGNYAIEIVSATGCKLPLQSFVDVPAKGFVPFSVPEKVNVCGTMDFIPSTASNLLFTLIYPSGEQISKEAGDLFRLNAAGLYNLMGTSTDLETGQCPRSQQFEVVLIDQPLFEPVLESEDCFGNKLYKADLFGADPGSLNFRWYDKDFNIVGRGLRWYPTGYGVFYLDVQPKGSSPCEFNPKAFEVKQPIFEVEVNLSSGLICPGGLLTTVSLETDFNEVQRIEWIFIDANGNQSFLGQFENESVIEIGEQGTYEAVVYNHIGCEIGRDLILVLESQSEKRPEVKGSYSICTESGYGETVNPGDFVAYEWFYNGEFISDAPTLKLNKGGDYVLYVTNQDGCVFESSFSTFEDCTFQYVFPNAMDLNDPNKLFEVWVNDAVDLAQLWIHNRQGELVYFCEGKNVQSRLAFCQWEGIKNGKYIPTGNYIVTMKIQSSRFGIEKKISQNLMVFR